MTYFGSYRSGPLLSGTMTVALYYRCGRPGSSRAFSMGEVRPGHYSIDGPCVLGDQKIMKG